jgi:phage terminase small subunit
VKAGRKKAPRGTSRHVAKSKARRLSERERRFVEAYMGKSAGNATDAIRRAGYKGTKASLNTMAARLLRRVEVLAAIEKRVNADPAIADRDERQRFWSGVLRGKPKARMGDRLKASELLGKSQADFVERHEHSFPKVHKLNLTVQG